MFRNRLSIHFINEWKQVFQIGECNWYGFTPVYLYFEIDEMTKAYECCVMVLGVGISLRYDRDFEHSEMQRIADEAYTEIMAERERGKGVIS